MKILLIDYFGFEKLMDHSGPEHKADLRYRVVVPMRVSSLGLPRHRHIDFIFVRDGNKTIRENKDDGYEVMSVPVYRQLDLPMELAPSIASTPMEKIVRVTELPSSEVVARSLWETHPLIKDFVNRVADHQLHILGSEASQMGKLEETMAIAWRRDECKLRAAMQNKAERLLENLRKKI